MHLEISSAENIDKVDSVSISMSVLYILLNNLKYSYVHTYSSPKVRLVKAMGLPVVMYGCESWTIKKAECRGIDASELWCWRRLLSVPWTARRSNQSILKEINPGVHWKD